VTFSFDLTDLRRYSHEVRRLVARDSTNNPNAAGNGSRISEGAGITADSSKLQKTLALIFDQNCLAMFVKCNK
jgi:hypothetical protein